MEHQVYLGLGSNLGDREANIQKAIELIDERIGRVVRQSSLLETEPWGFRSENRFLNGAILVETTKTPREVLTLTQQIERDLGRKSKSQPSSNHHSQFSILHSQLSNYADRAIDIDILLYDDITLDEPDLKIPHPLMQKRDFVMIPLKEIRQA